MNKSHLVKQWKKVYGEDFEKEYSGVFKKLPFHFDKKTLVRLWDKTYGEKFEKEYFLSQIRRFNGNMSKISNFTGMERTALYRKLKSLNININNI